MSEEKYEKIVEVLMHENNTLKAALLESERCLDNGMTMRDHFAGLAMQILLGGYSAPAYKDAAKLSYQMADAMLKAREEAYFELAY